jgi:hypothetical protein
MAIIGKLIAAGVAQHMSVGLDTLEAEIKYYQDRVDRAEQWLHRIYTEIEARFPASHTGATLLGRH